MKKLLLCIVAMYIAASAFSQSILTAGEFFKSVSEFYGTIRDFEAEVEITAARNTMRGKVSFKRPEMLRIDFSSPAGQVILFDGDNLKIYLPPPTSAILEQTVEGGGGPGLATPNGLNLMSRYYTIAYETGQDAVPLEEDSDELVVNLVLYRRASSEAFTQIRLSVSPKTKLIRRVVAYTPQGESFTFNFFNYNLNTNISTQRFIYDPPSSANNYNNFLFSE